MKRSIFFLSLVMAVLASAVFAHCQIPCGIYDDQLRIQLIKEHIQTIEKSINSINELSKKSEKDYNQLVRWIDNKEAHAQYIQDIASEYFLAQRIEPAATGTKEYAGYIARLVPMHELIVYAMRAKQGADPAVVAQLASSVSDFEKAYFK